MPRYNSALPDCVFKVQSKMSSEASEPGVNHNLIVTDPKESILCQILKSDEVTRIFRELNNCNLITNETTTGDQLFLQVEKESIHSQVLNSFEITRMFR